MDTLITVSSISGGSSPYDVWVCDDCTSSSVCQYINTVSSLPYSFTLPSEYNYYVTYGVKVIDNNNCVYCFGGFGSYISTWTTTAPNQPITLPYVTNGTYSGGITWGDGSFSANTYANRTHTYLSANTYTVTISGTCSGWNFNTSTGSTPSLITSVVSWGILSLNNTSNDTFSGCTNLNLSNTYGTLDLGTSKDLTNMFKGCTNLTSVNNINDWYTSSVTATTSMFSGCTLLNQSLSFNTNSVKNMDNMFRDCTTLNQPILFSTHSVTGMTSMFQNCTSFNQNVGIWNVENLKNATSFMSGKTTTNYSFLTNIYNSWATQNVRTGVTINFGTIQYMSSGSASKNILTGATKNWIITDGGQI